MTGAPAHPAVRLEEVDAGYGERLVVRDISLTIGAGTRVAVVGPNGAGKSTLFRVALGILPPWRGTVELLGRPARALDRRRHPVAYVPQARTLAAGFPVSARDVVAMGRVGRRGPFRWLGGADRAAVNRALAQIGLGHKADRPFGALSGGEQQRVLLARALASEARLFFLDEPVTGVDVMTQRQIDEILDRLVAAGCTIVASTHDLSDEHLGRFDRVVCLNRTIVAHGPPAEVTQLVAWRELFAGGPAPAAGG